ncbi:eukaryotic translation initiation factor 3 subunit J isoform X2 [Myotis daubentonii]|uniref:eukaryotic translation initiation factor 3 subunit J isoform X2 n=1 Tax=Myotis daubentonii TaxID=98922 RepID=UPI00287324D0|nr:eukaryotic translation initiation factor 3 subunit J isoform X2 [Myotis daubentonii]
MPSADRVPRLFRERMSPAPAASGSQEAAIPEHRALSDPCETPARPTRQAPSPRTRQGRRPGAPPSALAPSRARRARRLPGRGPLARRTAAPSGGSGGRSTVPVPTGGHGLQSPVPSVGVFLASATCHLRRAKGPTGRGGGGAGREGRRGPARTRREAALLTFLHSRFFRGAQAGVAASTPLAPSRPAGHRVSAAPSRALRGAASHVPRPLPARARVAAARGGGARARASSQPRSQRALRGPTRANPVTHPRRARSSLALPSHTLTPGSTWRRRLRRGTPTPGMRTRSPWKTRYGRWGPAVRPAGTAGKARTRTRTSREEGREREKHQSAASCMPPTGD